MTNYSLRLDLLRDTTFGRGDGLAGVVDVEVDHDEYGLPYLRGRALKGILVYECAEILFALQQQSHQSYTKWVAAAQFLFGQPGSHLKGQSHLKIGNATLPDELVQAVRYQSSLDDIQAGQWRNDVLNGLTTIRQQTAVASDGVARDSSLRASRLILRDTQFTAPLYFLANPSEHTQVKGLLAACVKAFRRAGTGRSRGPGLLQAHLFEDDTEVTDAWFKEFSKEVLS